MKIKTNLHFHTKDDIEDKKGASLVADHDLSEGLKKAKELGFQVLAVTCHNFVTDDEKYYKEANELGITLIRGIEKSVEKRDVLILNADKSAEKIETFQDLKRYKSGHPESFIIAPHPFFDAKHSLGEKLEENADIFDAVEYSWFHFKFLNFNKKAEYFSKKHNIPVIATSDTHHLHKLNGSYAFLEAENNSLESVFKAIRENKIENFSPPTKFWSGYTWRIIGKTFLNILKPSKDD